MRVLTPPRETCIGEDRERCTSAETCNRYGCTFCQVNVPARTSHSAQRLYLQCFTSLSDVALSWSRPPRRGKKQTRGQTGGVHVHLSSRTLKRATTRNSRMSQKKSLNPDARRRAVRHLREAFGVSERRACRVLGQLRSTQRRRPRPREWEQRLVARMLELVRLHPRFGYRRVWALLRREGKRANREGFNNASNRW